MTAAEKLTSLFIIIKITINYICKAPFSRKLIALYRIFYNDEMRKRRRRIESCKYNLLIARAHTHTHTHARTHARTHTPAM